AQRRGASSSQLPNTKKTGVLREKTAGKRSERSMGGLPSQSLRARACQPLASASLSHCRKNRATPKRAAEGRNLRYSVNSKRTVAACIHQRSSRKLRGTTG